MIRATGALAALGGSSALQAALIGSLKHINLVTKVGVPGSSGWRICNADM
jgi:hypothetical protein